jgi:spore coat protein U-like protein
MSFNQLVRRAAIIAVVAFATSQAYAADNKPLTVTATITGTCKLVAIPAMSFALDPTTAANGTATSAVSYRCTKGTPAPVFTVGGQLAAAGYSSGAAQALVGDTAGNTDVLPYRITWAAPTTAGSGLGSGVTPVVVNLTGTILNADFVDATADTYRGTVAIEITP